jgi:hypothetical protein
MSDPSSWFPELRPADERTALEQFLDQYRHIVTSQLADLDHAQASARVLVATDLTVGGIVKHLAWAEDRWFQGKLLGLELPEPWASAPLADRRDRSPRGPSRPVARCHRPRSVELAAASYCDGRL